MLSTACSSRNLEWLEAQLDAHEAEHRAQAAAEARRACHSACFESCGTMLAINLMFPFCQYVLVV